MEHEFWHDKWHRNEIGFHNSEAHPLLVKYLDELKLAEGGRIFLPLCGKTLDIAYLLAQGYRVAGAELSELAIQQLFEQLGVEPRIESFGSLTCYRGDGLDIFVGDIFELDAERLGPVDAVYDRAALVALPDSMRGQYTSHLVSITDVAPQLLIAFEYDQAQLAGPPFCVSAQEVERRYSDAYQLQQLASVNVPGGLKGQCPADEVVWLLQPRN